ncbi:hypothetical protein ACIB24_04455 [Spongisporangium articulatum]|uniref:Uncharacterized protein n=1 Tax=Spongisporangium articulatum TaxID=3362603 RepID=A0ABW8AIW6_9ACTN
MDEFNVVPFLIGLIVAALLGLASGWLASRAAGDQPVALNPLAGGSLWASVLLWVGFIGATIAGFSYMSAGGFWGRQALNLTIAALAFADVAFSARAVRVWHNKTLPVRRKRRAGPATRRTAE